MAVSSNEILAKLKLDAKDFNSKLTDTEKNVLKFSASVVAVGATLLYSAKKTAEFQDSTIKMARSAGVVVDKFSAYKHAAELSNVSTEILVQSLGKLANPASSSLKALEKLGITIKDNEGKLKSSDALFSELADKIKSVKDPTEQAGIAIQVFGDTGGKMVSMLKDGSAGLEEMAKQAGKLGLIVDNETGVAAEKFNDDLAVLEKATTSLGKTTGSLVIQLINGNGILTTLSETIMSANGSFSDMIKNSSNVAKSFTTAIFAAGTLTTGIAAIGGALKASGIIGSTAWMKMLGPLALGITAMTFIIDYVIRNRTETEMKRIKDNVEDIKKSFGSSSERIKQFSESMAIVEDNLNSGSASVEQTSNVLNSLGQSFGLVNLQTKNMTLDQVKTQLKSVKDAISELTKEAKKPIIPNFARQLQNDVKDLRPDIKPFHDSAVGSIGKTIEDMSMVWDNNFKDGKKLSLSQQASIISQQAASLVGNIAGIANQILDIAAQAAQRTVQSIQRKSQEAQLFFDVYMQHVQRNNELELAELDRQEKEKLNIIKNASNERLLALDFEYQEAKRKKEQEFLDYVAAERAKYEVYTQSLLDKTYDREQDILVNAEQENNWNEYLKSLQSQHDSDMLAMQTDYTSNQTQIQTQANTSAQAEQDRAAAIKQKKEEEQQAKDKDLKKKSALLQWMFSIAAYEATKNVQAMQTIVQGIAGAAQGFSLAAGTIPPPFGLVAGGILSAAIIGASSIAATQIRSAPPPLPPAELFLERGGVLSGPSHAQGGIAVRAEGSEGIIDKYRTSRLTENIDTLLSNNSAPVYNITFETGAIQNNGSMMDEAALNKLSEALARRLERQRINIRI